MVGIIHVNGLQRLFRAQVWRLSPEKKGSGQTHWCVFIQHPNRVIRSSEKQLRCNICRHFCETKQWRQCLVIGNVPGAGCWERVDPDVRT